MKLRLHAGSLLVYALILRFVQLPEATGWLHWALLYAVHSASDRIAGEIGLARLRLPAIEISAA
ncbi:MAG: hypothetical protein VX463_19830 [Pseudomonadota bacterium]|nr:hypothetical protein [Pseudomonadota bacterium]